MIIDLNLLHCPQDIAASIIGSAANGSAADVSAEYAAFDAVTSTKALMEAAKLYTLSGDTFHNLCSHNAGVASRLGMFHTAETWRMMVALYSTALSYEEAGKMASKAAAAKRAAANSSANVDAGGESDTDADHDESESGMDSRRRTRHGSSTARARRASGRARAASAVSVDVATAAANAASAVAAAAAAASSSSTTATAALTTAHSAAAASAMSLLGGGGAAAAAGAYVAAMHSSLDGAEGESEEIESGKMGEMYEYDVGRQSPEELCNDGSFRVPSAKIILQSFSDLEDENDLTLTNIASGQMLSTISGGDFYGDSDGLDALCLEQFVHADTGPAYAEINIRRLLEIENNCFVKELEEDRQSEKDTESLMQLMIPTVRFNFLTRFLKLPVPCHW